MSKKIIPLLVGKTCNVNLLQELKPTTTRGLCYEKINCSGYRIRLGFGVFGGYGLMAQFVAFGPLAKYTFGVVVGIGLFYIGILINNYNKKY